MTKHELLRKVTQFYLKSDDFNGLAVESLQLPEEDLKSLLSELIREGLVSLNFGDRHPNPHINAFDPEGKDEQLAKIQRLGVKSACVYPSEMHLSSVVKRHSYGIGPFTLKLRLGEPQFRFYSFDLSVLELYRNDPRYYYNVDDICGSISALIESLEKGEMRKSDQVYLQSFGFSYDSNMNRGVAVFLRYLHDLTSEHQQIWKAKLLSGDYKLHPDYFRSSMGHYSEGLSVFRAFVEEMHQINEMSKLMNRQPLFRNDYHERKRPKEFSFLIRPTLKDLNSFIHSPRQDGLGQY